MTQVENQATMTSDYARILRDNIARVRDRIRQAALRAGRSADSVRLVAVTKYVDLATAGLLVEAGCTDLGESRPQELWRKAEALATVVKPPEKLQWHLIGHLQRNKVTRTLSVANWIHSVDSPRLLQAIQDAATNEHIAPALLLEVNVSGDATKTGMSPDEAKQIASQLAGQPTANVRGLMAMAGISSNAQQTRDEFRQVRELHQTLQALYPSLGWTELSIGMSDDFEIAIEEGATMVRVGSALFEGIPRAGT